MVKRVGRPRHSGVLNQAREVLLAQKTEDAIDLACVSTSTRHNRPVPAQVINNRPISILIFNISYKVVITSKVTYFSPSGRISGRLSRGIGR